MRGTFHEIGTGEAEACLLCDGACLLAEICSCCRRCIAGLHILFCQVLLASSASLG